MLLGQGFFDTIFDPFTDSTVYFLMAAIGTGLFLLKFALMFFGGMDDGSDLDVDVDGDLDHDDSGGGFSLFSLLSILSFLMGAGWMGLGCRMEWKMDPFVSGAAAGGFGFFLMFLSSFGMYQMRKLNQVNRFDPTQAVGQIARVYMSIPPKGEGQGQVQITVDGKQKVMTAVSKGSEKIESFTAVKVVDIQEGQTLIVEPE